MIALPSLRRHEQPSHSIFDKFVIAAHASDDGRQSSGHVFQNGVRKPFSPGRKHGDITASKNLRNIAATAKEEKVLIETQIRDLLFKTRPLLSVTDKNKSGGRKLADNRGRRCNQPGMPFHIGVHVPDHNDELALACSGNRSSRSLGLFEISRDPLRYE